MSERKLPLPLQITSDAESVKFMVLPHAEAAQLIGSLANIPAIPCEHQGKSGFFLSKESHDAIRDHLAGLHEAIKKSRFLTPPQTPPSHKEPSRE